MQAGILKNRSYHQAVKILDQAASDAVSTLDGATSAQAIKEALAARRKMFHAIKHLSTDGRIN